MQDNIRQILTEIAEEHDITFKQAQEVYESFYKGVRFYMEKEDAKIIDLRHLAKLKKK